ncbi:MAG: methyltransferase domain-containing protein [Patescibacteria group bacterium]|nr:methyltransferase domain-containing protein [Patescibacteria group bacterium]MDD4610738.1 methyltransferase domain-containing protein [Patescibacteria group bacterium]
MKVLIENEAGSDQKNLFNEKTLEYSRTHTISRKYPYPYGFILNTTSGDGDNLDCFIITDKELKSGQIVECEPIGLMEQTETAWDKSKNNIEEEDHNVLMIIPREKTKIDDGVKEKLREFVLHAFDHLPGKKVRVGSFLGKNEALQYIEKMTLQNKIIEEFGSDATQANYVKKVDRGLWDSEKILIDKYFQTGCSILDIGCGTGRTTISLFKLGYKVSGVDITPEMIQNAQKIAKEKNLNISYEVGDAAKLKYADNSFDNAIFSNNGFGQIPGSEKRQNALKEIYRVLKPGGCFILVAHARFKGDISRFWIKNWLKIYILKPLGFKIEELEFGDYIFERYINDIKIGRTQFMHIANAKNLKKQIEMAGFKIIFSGRENKITTENLHDRDNVYDFAPMFYVCKKIKM